MNNKYIRWEDGIFDPIMVNRLISNKNYHTLICFNCSFRRNRKFIRVNRLEYTVKDNLIRCPNCGDLIKFSIRGKARFIKEERESDE